MRRVFPALVVGCLLAACGSNSDRVRNSTPTPTDSYIGTLAPTLLPTPTPTATPVSLSRRPTARPTSAPPQNNPRPPSRPRVLIVMLENKGYAATLGTCSADRYLCSLASQYASVIGWNGVGHPSLPNYLAITSGSTQGCSSDSCARGRYHTDLMAQLNAAGVPWTMYAESMPTPCEINDSGNYVVHHNPAPYYTDAACPARDLPYPGAARLVTTLDGAASPDFVWITPNNVDNMHSGTVQAGDAWLRANLPGVLTSSWFTSGNATVIVTMDENDIDGSGVPMVVISTNSRGVGAVTMHGNHYGTLRAIEEAFHLALLGGARSPNYGDIIRYFG
jgi:hypothetical protein